MSNTWITTRFSQKNKDSISIVAPYVYATSILFSSQVAARTTCVDFVLETWLRKPKETINS